MSSLILTFGLKIIVFFWFLHLFLYSGYWSQLPFDCKKFYLCFFVHHNDVRAVGLRLHHSLARVKILTKPALNQCTIFLVITRVSICAGDNCAAAVKSKIHCRFARDIYFRPMWSRFLLGFLFSVDLSFFILPLCGFSAYSFISSMEHPILVQKGFWFVCPFEDLFTHVGRMTSPHTPVQGTDIYGWPQWSCHGFVSAQWNKIRRVNSNYSD